MSTQATAQKAKTKAKRVLASRDLVPGFAKLVKETRIARNWSQRQLAHQAGVSPMCISDLEAENRSPSLRVASSIAAALHLTVRLAQPARPIKRRAPKRPDPDPTSMSA